MTAPSHHPLSLEGASTLLDALAEVDVAGGEVTLSFTGNRPGRDGVHAGVWTAYVLTDPRPDGLCARGGGSSHPDLATAIAEALTAVSDLEGAPRG